MASKHSKKACCSDCEEKGGSCKDKKCDPCVEAVVLNLGRYFRESAPSINYAALNDLPITEQERVARGQLFINYLIQANAFFRLTMQNLAARKCPCCAAVAVSLADTSLGYTSYASASVLSLGNPIAQLPAFMTQLFEIYKSTVGAILATAGCA